MKPKGVYHFDAGTFAASVVGLGEQLASVVLTVEELVPGLIWYVADVECVGLQMNQTNIPFRVGNCFETIDALLRIEQAMWGVFVGVPAQCETPRFREGGLRSDDDEWSDLGDAVIEVRVFDASFITVASDCLHSTIAPDFTNLFSKNIDKLRNEGASRSHRDVSRNA